VRDSKLIENNLELSFEFTRYLLAHPEMDERIPKGAQVVLLPDCDERLALTCGFLTSSGKMDNRWYTCGSKS
jgi:hypothetical protein